MSTLVSYFLVNNGANENVIYFDEKYVTSETKIKHMKVNYITAYNEVLMNAIDETIANGLTIASPLTFGATFTIGDNATESLSQLCTANSITFEPTRLYIFIIPVGATYQGIELTKDGTGEVFIIHNGDRAILHSSGTGTELDVIQRTPLNLTSTSMVVDTTDPELPTLNLTLTGNINNGNIVTSAYASNVYTFTAALNSLTIRDQFDFETNADYIGNIDILNQELISIYDRMSTLKKMMVTMDTTFANGIIASHTKASGTSLGAVLTLNNTGVAFGTFLIGQTLSATGIPNNTTITAITTTTHLNDTLTLSANLTSTLTNATIQVIGPINYADLMAWDENFYDNNSNNYNYYWPTGLTSDFNLIFPPCFSILSLTKCSGILTLQFSNGCDDDTQLWIHDEPSFGSGTTKLDMTNGSITKSKNVLYTYVYTLTSADTYIYFKLVKLDNDAVILYSPTKFIKN